MTTVDRIDNFFLNDVGLYLEIGRWPRWLRRTFILTMPISGLLYFIAFILIMFGFTFGGFVGVGIDVVGFLIDVWSRP